MENSFELNHLDELPKVAKGLVGLFNTRCVVFTGDMGAGKTTLIKSVCACLGSQDVISSPTFSVVNEYKCPHGSIYHFDWYRLKEEEEALDIGLDEYLSSGYLCLMEWPEKIRNLLPEQMDWVKIELQGSKRLITHKIIANE